MKCPNCGFEHDAQKTECLRCGIIFSKFRQAESVKPEAEAPKNLAPPASDQESDDDDEGFVKRLLFYVKPRINPMEFGFRTVAAGILLVWGLWYICLSVNGYYNNSILWNYVNLPFHEAGHILFRPFGRFMTSLGGTLGQLLMPLVCMGVFLVKVRDTFAAAFCMWWLGVNFMDIAPYIDDARRLTMPLLGGNTGQTSPYGFHDWEFILTETRLLRYDHTFAWFSYKIGCLLMIIAFVWWGIVLYKQYHNLDSSYIGD